MTFNDAARSYIRRIRNTAKRDYAYAYLAYMDGVRPAEPEWPRGRLSYLACQAVRHELVGIRNETEGGTKDENG